MKYIFRVFSYLVIFSQLMLFLSACDGEIDRAIEKADQALAILDKAITTLAGESTKWRQTLEETRDKLIDATQSTIKNEVNNLINNGIAATGVEIRCNIDFVGKRLRQELIYKRNDLAKKRNDLVNNKKTSGFNKKVAVSLLPEELLEPGVCQVIPTSVDLSLEPARRSELVLTGYDFDKTKITVKLLNSGQELDVTEQLAQPSQYKLSLNLSPVRGIPLSEKSDKIFVRSTKTGKLISEINVIQPPPAPVPPPKPDYSQYITNILIRTNRSNGNSCPSDMSWNPQDLNEGAKGEFIHLCYSKGGDNKPITDLQITSNSNPGNLCGANWQWNSEDLNKDAGGDFIHLCFRKDGQQPIKNISFTSNAKPGNLCPAGWAWIDKDLNKGAKGNFIYLCYLK